MADDEDRARPGAAAVAGGLGSAHRADRRGGDRADGAQRAPLLGARYRLPADQRPVRDPYHKTFISTAAGAGRSLLEFTNPEEAGQKILRLDDEIYLYFPEAEEVIHLQGAALRENVLGSDFSYEDMTGAGSLLDDYEVVLEGNEPIAGRDCYRLRLTARRRDVVYPRQVVWIDAEQFVTRRVEQFSRRGRALKRMVVSDYRAVGDKLIAVRLEMSDLMKRDSRTVFLIDAIEVDGAVDETLFSLEELTF